ncbi:MAG: DUF2254 domain-containing protein [Oculatellaceae cyanobacterium Prado106]|jgi:uncharacterized membrane protein|nr:DUF2254 domain-containing protein [Oculatellaceae cyanobacterium Prado106]
MKNAKLSKVWDTLHSSYWFLPTLMVLGVIILAATTLTLDGQGRVNLAGWNWMYTGGPDGARAMLSAVAGSVITVATTAFSITIVALQLAASNFGPRLLRNFMRDTGNQLVLGTFIATFVYCLLVIRTIHGEGQNYSQFVPQLSVTVGTGLAIISVAVLIYFIHHASTIIQVSHVIASVSQDLERTGDRIFPQEIGHSLPPSSSQIEALTKAFRDHATAVPSTQEGYLQAIEDEDLLKLACRYDVQFCVESRPGQFILRDSALVRVLPGDRVSPKLIKRINQNFIVSKERNEQQDIEFPINQLVEIALRALSPSVNDPFTAMRCIDRLSAALTRLAQRPMPSPYRYDPAQHLRVIAEPVTFEHLVNRAFDQIRQCARTDAAVTMRLLEAIDRILMHTSNPEHRTALWRQAKMIEQGSHEGLPEEQDQKAVAKRYDTILRRRDP